MKLLDTYILHLVSPPTYWIVKLKTWRYKEVYKWDIGLKWVPDHFLVCIEAPTGGAL